MKFFDNLRDPTDIDHITNHFYTIFHDAEHYYGEQTYFEKAIINPNFKGFNQGKNVLEEKKYKDKSKLLKDFYEIRNPIY